MYVSEYAMGMVRERLGSDLIEGVSYREWEIWRADLRLRGSQVGAASAKFKRSRSLAVSRRVLRSIQVQIQIKILRILSLGNQNKF